MVVFSSLVRMTSRMPRNVFFREMSEHRTFTIEPSRFQYRKFKDFIHLYFMLGLIPCGLVITYANVFIGPATLSEIPEDYTPKHWEYYRHPISRFIARYIMPSHQQDYEKYLSFIFIEHEKSKIRRLEKDIESKIKERGDFQLYYYRPVMAKYPRMIREKSDHLAKFAE